LISPSSCAAAAAGVSLGVWVCPWTAAQIFLGGKKAPSFAYSHGLGSATNQQRLALILSAIKLVLPAWLYAKKLDPVVDLLSGYIVYAFVQGEIILVVIRRLDLSHICVCVAFRRELISDIAGC
jgi:hypothetical protein